MALYRRGGGKIWWYEFQFNGERIQRSAQTADKRAALQIESAHRVALAKGTAGIQPQLPIPTFRDFAPRFTEAIETLCANKPDTVKFYKAKLRALLKYEAIASARLDAIDEAVIQAFKQVDDFRLQRDCDEQAHEGFDGGPRMCKRMRS